MDEGESRANAPVTPVPAAKKGPWFAVISLVALVAFLAGALATAWPTLTGTSDDDRIAALETELGALRSNLTVAGQQTQTISGRVDTLERNTPGIAGADGGQNLDERVRAAEQGVAATSQATATLLARLNNVEAATPPNLGEMLQNFARRDEQATLSARVTQLESVKQAAALLAMARLARASEASEPFAREFEVLAALAPNDPAVGALRPLAARGVPAETLLIAGFPNLARATINADRVSRERGLWDRLFNGLARLVGWRRVGDIPGDDAEARLARSQVALDRGDLRAAVNEISRLTGVARSTMTPWLLDAEARLSIDDAITSMDERLLSALAMPSAQVTPPR